MKATEQRHALRWAESYGLSFLPVLCLSAFYKCPVTIVTGDGRCSAIKNKRQIMITKLRPYGTLVLQCTFVLLLLFVTSCTTHVPYPFKDEVVLGEKLPIDGTWVNQKNARFRISGGIMFVADPGINPPLRNGQVIAKNIKQVSNRKYTLDAGSHNTTPGIAGFGRGEIEVVSNSSLGAHFSKRTNPALAGRRE